MARSPFSVDYRDCEAVIAYAKELGGDCIVIKKKDHPNYNITHASRTDQYEESEVVWRKP